MQRNEDEHHRTVAASTIGRRSDDDDDDDKHHTAETNNNHHMVETTTATTTTSTTTFIRCVVPVITSGTSTSGTLTTRTTGITSHENHDPPPPPLPLRNDDDENDNFGGGYHIGQFVSVMSRTSPGINQPGGIGRITNIRHVTNDDVNLHHHDDHHHIRLSVKYVLDGRHEKNIAWMYVQPYTDLDDDDTAPPTDPTMNTSQQRHPSSVLVPHRHRTKLRNRNLLLGRCTYCGSLRTDCQSQCVVRDTHPTVLRRHTHHYSVTTTTTTTHHVDDVDNHSNDSSRSGNRSNSSSSCIDDSDSSSNSEAQYDSMIQQHRKEFLQYKRLVPSKGPALPVTTTSTRRRRNDRSYTTTVSPRTLQRKYHHRRRIATDVLATIAMEEEEEDAVVAVVVKHQTSNDERQNHSNLGQNTGTIGTDHCDRNSSSSSSDDDDMDDEEEEESDPYGNFDHLSLQQLAALPPPKRVIRPRMPLRPQHHRTRQRHHDAVWNPLLWWNSSTNTVDRPLDANDSRENDGIGHDDDTHNNPISDTTRTSFIQPEGNATRLPKDVPDTTQSLSYAQVLSMFDTTMHRITTVDIPHAQQQLRQFERDYQQSYRDRIHSHESQHHNNNNSNHHNHKKNNNNGHHSSDLRSSVESLLLKR